MSIKDILTDN